MSSVNRVILIGRVGQDPEIRQTQAGKRIANLSLATSESWKSKDTGEKQEKTTWHKIAVFNDGLCGVIQNYVKKGSQLYIEGSLQTRKYTDNSGVERYVTEVVLQNYNGQLVLLGGSPSAEGGTHQQKKADGFAPNFDEISF